MTAERIRQTGRDSWHARQGYQYQQRVPGPIDWSGLDPREPRPFTARWWGLCGAVLVLTVCVVIGASIVE